MALTWSSSLDASTSTGWRRAVAIQIDRANTAARDAGLGDRLSFHEGVIHDIPVADQTVDFVWCRDVLRQVDDLAGAFAELVRVTKLRRRDARLHPQ